jgi:N-acetylglucosaminyl-diphospho-decaprenol L-rhamnosyltransferase
MRVAAVTLVHGRHDHLRGLLGGLRDGSRTPDLVVVAAMDDPEVAGVVHAEAGPAEVHVVDVPRVDGLPLAAARNAAAAGAVDAGADLLVFLDVDCIPSSSLVARYADAARSWDGPNPVALAGAVHYLPPRPAGQRAYRPDDLHRSAPHPARPALDGAVTEVAEDVRLFWSLSFAMSTPDWRQVGGFDEEYRGYGGEDTDFGMRLAAAGGSLVWVGDAVAYHQHHPVESPPYRHLDDIVVNANRFWDRWGFSPMEGWLAAFEAAGLVTQTGRPPRWTRTAAAGSGARTA